MYYIAVVFSAVLALLEWHQENNVDVNKDVSAANIYKFMKEVAQKCPMVQVLYNEIRIAEVIFLLQQAEEEGDTKKFI